MPVSKLKNLAILILLLANAALLCLLVPRQLHQRQQTQALRDSVSRLCAEQNVVLDSDHVPETITLYPLELADSAAAETAALTALLNETPEKTDSGRLTSPSIRLGSWENGVLSLKLSGQKEVSNLRSAASRTLGKMGFQTHSLDTPTRLSPGIYSLNAVQSVLGVPVFSGGLTLTYANSALSDLSGTFFTGTLTRADDTACITAAEAVVAFLSARMELGWVGSAITGLEQGYYNYASAGTAIRLTPVWKITTDTGSFLVNGQNWEVSVFS